MRVSIRDVADLAGTSRMTVSNVLNGRDARVSPAMRAKVWQAVKDLGYVPVASPISQKRRSLTHTIGVDFDTFRAFDTGIGNALFEGMVAAAKELDYDLLSVLRAPRRWEGHPGEVALLDGRADAFVFLNSLQHGREDTLKALLEHEIPAVVAFRRDVPEGVATIDCDNVSATEIAVRHLVDLGHTRIAHIVGDRQRSTADYRMQGYLQTMNSLGLYQGDDWLLNAWSFVMSHELLPVIADSVLHLGATAVVCASDALALSLWDELERRGLRVPQDISLTGIDDVWSARARGLTTSAVPGREIGALSISLCDQMVRGEDDVQLHHVLPVELKVRASTAPPRKA